MTVVPPVLENLRGARVLVTGASGFIASHLVERLAALGAEVAALSRSRGRLDEIDAHGRYAYLQCDLTDAALTRDVVAAFCPEIVFHFASRPDGFETFEHASGAINLNISGTLNLLEALRLCATRAIVYGDSCKVYGSHAPVPYRESTPTDPNSSYSISKLAGWHMCQLYARIHRFNAVAVRPTLIYGPRQGNNIIGFVIRSLLAGERGILLDGGTQTRDPLYIADAVDAFIAAAEQSPCINGRVINVGGGREVTVERLAQVIVQLVGGGAEVVCRPHRARETEMWRSYCDNEEAEALLGWRPRTSLAGGIQQTIDYLSLAHAGAKVGDA